MTNEELIHHLNNLVAFNMKAGAEITHVEPGLVRGRLRDTGDNTNHNGDIAAGGIFTLGEFMPGVLLSAELLGIDVFLVVRRVEIDFVGIGRGELWAECRLDDEAADVLERFKNGAVRKFESTLPVIVREVEEKEVARLRGTYYIRRMTAALKKKSSPG